MRCVADPQENMANAISKIREAAAKGAEVICLPELFRSLYFCQVESHDYFKLGEEIPGPSTSELSAVAN